ncbi:2-dehydropantoate 2-reductase [Salipaludibacillus daqingensis]|uniref:2-dehydropantoate 2-reductase n=1 Tax=Salipaludibacillus daqingensis TaxID=3041001 RepID=UPI002475794C|nr:2-dehydropantoate 2-reductase [Salipaludibacillus daqingensis]
MKITIVGAGAIGLLTSTYLQECGHSVKVVTRTNEQAAFIHLHGITRFYEGEEINKSILAISFEAYRPGKEDVIIATMKQSHLNSFIDWVNHRMEGNIPILFMQNGMGHIEKAKDILNHPIFSAVVTHGAIKKGWNEVVHTGVGNIQVGGDGTKKHIFASLWSTTDRFPIYWSDNIEEAMKKKLLVNVVVNPITAIHQVKNGALLTDEILHKQAYTIFDEARKILEFPKEMWSEVEDVIRRTKNNYSSMSVDIKLGRNTEIDAITGYLLKIASKNNQSSVNIQQIHNEIKRLERKGQDV